MQIPKVICEMGKGCTGSALHHPGVTVCFSIDGVKPLRKHDHVIYEPHRGKTNNVGPTQTGLYKHRKELEA